MMTERERELTMLLRTITRNKMESKLAKERLEAERPVGTAVWTRHGKGQVAGERPWEGAERRQVRFVRGVQSARSWDSGRNSGGLHGVVLGRCSQWTYS